MSRYKCVESFAVDQCDDDGFSLNRSKTIKSGTVWEKADKDIIGGEVHLDRVGAAYEWLEIAKEHLNMFFVEEAMPEPSKGDKDANS